MNKNGILTDNIIGCDLKNRFEVFEHMIHASLTKIVHQTSTPAHWQIFSKIFKKDFELM